MIEHTSQSDDLRSHTKIITSEMPVTQAGKQIGAQCEIQEAKSSPDK